MSQSHSSERQLGQHSPEERMSALFANLVVQQTNMTLMLLGRVPNPETGERVQDLEAAQMFIDQLEMLEAKTKGNLDKREEQLLKQSLTTLRMAFVEGIQSAPVEAGRTATAAPEEKAHATNPIAEPTAPGVAEQEETRKKFSKKY